MNDLNDGPGAHAAPTPLASFQSRLRAMATRLPYRSEGNGLAAPAGVASPPASGDAETGLLALRAKIWDLAGPALAENFFTTLVQMLSMIMVGHVGAVAVTAVGLTNQPYMLALALSFALNVGTTAVVARSVGARDYATANEAAKQSFAVNAVIAIVFAILGYVFAAPILVFMGAGPDVVPSGVTYLRITSLCFPFASLAIAISAVLRGAGDTRTPMRINMLANVVVVVLGYPLIYGLFGVPGLGVAGAAVATGAARFTGLILGARALIGGHVPVRIGLKEGYRPNWAVLRRITRIGVPSAGEQFVMRTGQIAFVKVVATLGTAVFAAHQIGLNILSLSFMPGMAFAVAATTLVGQNLGARRPEQAVTVGWEVRRLGMWLAWSVGGVFIIFGPWIMRLYTNDPVVIAQGAVALKIIGLIQPMQISQFILAGALRGAGDTRWPLYATMAGMWGFRVILSYLFVTVLGFGLAGAWTSMALDQLARSSVILYRYRHSEQWIKAKV